MRKSAPRNVALLAAMLLTASLCACTAETTGAAPSTTGATSEAPTPADHITIRSAVISNRGIHIEYPQLSGMVDLEQQRTLNLLIKQSIWNDTAAETLEDFALSQITYDLKYKVTLRSESVLSVAFSGSVYIEGGIHTTQVVQAETFDLRRATKISLSDIVSVDDSLLQRLRQATDVVSAAGDPVDPSELARATQPMDIGGVPFLEDLAAGCAGFYLEREALVVSVPISFAGGQYALVSVPGDYASRLYRPEPVS